MTRVVLGSASPGRRKVLRQAGIDPLVVVSGVDEDDVVLSLGPNPSLSRITASLAKAKAERVVTLLDPTVAVDAVVIGCDSILFCDGKLRGKPESAEAARGFWRSMAGRHGQLHTGHCLIRLRDDRVVFQDAQTAVTTVRFGAPTPEELAAYVDSGEPLKVAGGFTLDGLGGWFIDGVNGDPSSVVGISLPLTRRLLQDAGLSLVDVWKDNPLK